MKKIYDILKELSGMDEITSKSSLHDDLMLDSLAMVTLLVELEENYNIQLDESDMNPFDFNDVQSIIDLVKKYGGDLNE